MPYDLWITRARRLADVGKAAKRPVDADRAAQLMEQAPGVQRYGPTWRVRRLDTGDPWFVGRVQDGHVVLSCSYTNHRFLANAADALHVAARFAAALEARAFEAVRGDLFDAKVVGALADPNGKYLQQLSTTFQGALRQLDADGAAPLEWPNGPMEMVPEYCAFELAVPDLQVAVEVAARHPGVTKVQLLGPTSALVEGGLGPTTRLLHRPDGVLQVWPVHGRQPFAATAAPTLALALAVRDQLGAAMRYRGVAVEGALEAALRERVQGLGVDLHEWVLRGGRG